MEESQKLDQNDHRRLGQELDLFVTSEIVGSGLPMLTPRGTILREGLTAYANELRLSRGYQKVWTPHLTKTDLYKTSGHWDKFGHELFLVQSQETSDKLVLKPMNCPHHIQIYSCRPRSYRELPIKFLETATVYRDEKSGELAGLSRVRSITIDDTHVFARPEQVDEILKELIEVAREFYKTLGMELKFRLSFRDDSDVYIGSRELWDKAQAEIEKIAKEENLHYSVEAGDAAFYGPKIDFLATDVQGRTWQVATVQLDFMLPDRFKMSYTDENGQPQRPVMIHAALLGSVERFLAVYIEHTSGRFPLWLAPEQLRIITLNDEEEILKMAKSIINQAGQKGIRAYIDDSNESVAKKIHDAEVMKVPYMAVVGPKEVQSQQVKARNRSDLEEVDSLSVEALLHRLSSDVEKRQ